MRGKVIDIDKTQIQLINLIDEWLRDEMMEKGIPQKQWQVITEARMFLTQILDRGWYREGSEDQYLLIGLRSEWIRNGGKWKAY